MRKLDFLVLTVLLLVAFLCCNRQNIKIVGHPDYPEFKKDVMSGLNLLEEKSPEHYKLVMDNLWKVFFTEDDFNGVYTNSSVGVSRRAYTCYTAHEEYKPYYFALFLVHEATHIKRMKEGLDKDDEEEERTAMEAALAAAEIIGAPDAVKEYQAGTLERWKEWVKKYKK